MKRLLLVVVFASSAQFLSKVAFPAEPASAPATTTSAPATQPAEGLGSYDVLPEIIWQVSGGEGNQFQNGVWQYQYHPDQTPALHTSISLLASPVRLKMLVESDGPGDSISLILGSQFQRFEREIGKLTQKGEQMLEAPLGDMAGWKHEGGENDGKVRPPLRLLSLRLGQSPQRLGKGSVLLKRLIVETHYTPRDAVILIPELQEKEGSLEFAVRIRNLRPQGSNGTLAIDVRSAGDRLALVTGDLELKPAAAIRKTFKVQPGDENFIDASMRWLEPGLEVKPADIGWVRAVELPADAGLKPESRIGAGLYLYRWRGNPQAPEKMKEMAELAQRAGVKWSREEMQWRVIEPREGQFDWAFYDQMVDLERQHGISVYGLLAYWSDWAKANTDEGIEQYCRWARQVVRHFKGRIRHWEIWNEPNIFFWTGPRELYARLLAKAYAAIKSEDPDAVVMGCSTAGIDRAFITQVMKAGGTFDALTIHPYRGVFEDLKYIKELQETRELVEGKPVWITEIGFPSQLLTGYSERNQASLVSRTYLTSLASNAIDNVSWYNFRNDGSDPFYNEDNFGLIRHDLALKPGYRALAVVSQLLGNLKLIGPIEVKFGPTDAYGFRFTDGAQDTIVICSPGEGGLICFKSAQDLKVVNAFGEPVQPVKTEPGDTLPLDPGFPVFLAGKSPLAFSTVEPQWSVKLERRSVRVGEKVRFVMKVPIAGMDWDLPFDWPLPTGLPDGSFEFSIPDFTPPGGYIVQVGAGGVRQPFALRVESAGAANH